MTDPDAGDSCLIPRGAESTDRNINTVNDEHHLINRESDKKKYLTSVSSEDGSGHQVQAENSRTSSQGVNKAASGINDRNESISTTNGQTTSNINHNELTQHNRADGTQFQTNENTEPSIQNNNENQNQMIDESHGQIAETAARIGARPCGDGHQGAANGTGLASSTREGEGDEDLGPPPPYPGFAAITPSTATSTSYVCGAQAYPQEAPPSYPANETYQVSEFYPAYSATTTCPAYSSAGPYGAAAYSSSTVYPGVYAAPFTQQPYPYPTLDKRAGYCPRVAHRACDEQVTITTQPAPRSCAGTPVVGGRSTGGRPNNYLSLSILTCMCFSPLFGLIAICYSVMSNQAYAMGDIEGATQKSHTALGLNILGIGTSTLLMAVIVLL